MKHVQLSSAILLLCAALTAPPSQAQDASGYAGSFSSNEGIGVYGYSNGDRSEPNPLAPGVYGQSNRGVGVYGRGDTSDTYSFNNEGGYFEGGKGLYARGTDPVAQQGYGARIYSNNYRGMYAQGGSGWFDGYFGGDAGISTNGVVDRAARTQSLVVNLGTSPIEPGDLVAMAGVASSPDNGQAMLGVAKLDASNQHAVIGVAQQAVLSRTVSMHDGSEYVDFQPTTGSSEANGYLVIVTGGLAPAVNLTSLTLLSKGKIGDKIALSSQPDNEVALTLSNNSIYPTDAIVIGKMAGAINETNGTIPMFIDID